MKRNFNFLEWLPWEQNASPILLTLTLNSGMKELRDYFGMGLWTSVIIFEKGQAKWLFRPKELKLLGQKMIDFLMSPTYRINFLNSYANTEAELLKETQKIQFNTKLESLDDISLINLFKNFSKKYYKWYKYGWFCEPIQFQSQDILISWFNEMSSNRKIPFKETDIKQILFTVEEDTFAVEILRHLSLCSVTLKVFLKSISSLQIAKWAGFSKNGIKRVAKEILFITRNQNNAESLELLKLLKEHCNNYYWKQNNYYSTKFLTEKDVLEEILSFKGFDLLDASKAFKEEIRKIEKDRKKNTKKKSKFMQILPPYKRDIAMLASSIGGIFLDKRKKVIMISNSAFDHIIKEVAKRTGFDIKDCRYLIPQELEYFISEPNRYIERLKDRKKLFFIYQGDFSVLEDLYPQSKIFKQQNWQINFKEIYMKEPLIAEGDEAKKIINELDSRLNLFTDSKQISKKKINGTTVYFEQNNPIIHGKVRIIRNPKKEKLKEGEILVAPSTTPDYIDAISKCRAIITDWGGLTSHAAIVSRELKKPCIIGTNYATQILKNFYTVRLNLLKGTVEIID